MPTIICPCNDLTDDQVDEVVKNGAKTLDEVFAALHGDLYCGTCLTDIDDVIFGADN